MMLDQELATYQRELPELLKSHEGEFVLIKGEQIMGFWKTEDEAINAGYDRFGVVPIFVQKIQRDEKPLFLISHPSLPCHRQPHPELDHV